MRNKTRPSRIPPLGPEVAERVVADACRSAGRDDALDRRHDGASGWHHQRKRWRRIWKAHGLHPNRRRQFKPSNDPQFVNKQRIPDR